MTLTGDQLDLWMSGYASGYLTGLERGREVERDEIATLQREAARIVRTLAMGPARGQELTPEAAEQRRQAGIDAFRADHARRRAQGGDADG